MNTVTLMVWEKLAEIIRMYHTLLSSEGFRKGMDLYFERHDGTGVTCDDFRAAMADANNVDLEQFGLWYSTKGTPTLTYSTEYDESSRTVSITLSQSSESDLPLHIPVSVGLLDKKSGKEVMPTTVLELKEETQTFEFNDVDGDVIPSVLRGFSAPVKLLPSSGAEEEEELGFLAAYDTDGFNKWEAGQKLYTSLIFQHMNEAVNEKTTNHVYEAFQRTLEGSQKADLSGQAYALTLPGESTLAELVDVVDPAAIRKARGAVKSAIARRFRDEIAARYEEITNDIKQEGESFSVDSKSVGLRRLRNCLLEYLCSIKETKEEQIEAATLASQHFNEATGMTDKMSALTALVSMDGEGEQAREKALLQFYEDAGGDALVVDKWFTVQALADLPDVIERVKKLSEHKDFTLSNPNRCRSLLSAFAMNSAPFHDPSGAGYEFLAKSIAELDKLNPQISSRMAGSLVQWRKYDDHRAGLMKGELQKLASIKEISPDLFEVVSRGLKE